MMRTGLIRFFAPALLTAAIYAIPFAALPDPAFGLQAKSQRGATNEKDALVRLGKRLYDGTCSVCHGLDGEGQGELGFKLTSPATSSWSDGELASKIIYGNLPKGMPPFGIRFLGRGTLRDFGTVRGAIDVESLVAYIRDLQRRAREKERQADQAVAAPPVLLDSDPARGARLFETTAKCARCHSVKGKGGAAGPDLSSLASRLSRDAIYEAIKLPSRKIAPKYRMKELNMGRGRKVNGIYRAETSESIELYDAEANRWSAYNKSDVLFYRPLKTSLMPEGLLKSLTDSEVGDLLAFLTSLE